METLVQNETLDSLLELLHMPIIHTGEGIKVVAKAEHKYIKDLKINVSNSLNLPNLSSKESALLALAVAINDKKEHLIVALTEIAQQQGANNAEVAETYACVSLLNVNNVFYRFRHFIKKDYYETTPAGIKMSIMMNPVMGKEFFELMSLAVSALNGCELCVNAHEDSLVKLGSSQARIYDSIRLAATIRGLTVII